MIHTLPEPIEGQTHVQITKRTTYPDSGMVIHYRFGTVDADGEFIPSRWPEQKRGIPKPQASAVRQRAADAGAPVTAGTQEHRAADELAVMDAEGLW